ncbi:hypothetical protein F0U60_06975 [Archangium minus]|uniref:FG-GAP repeat protein n=1 Tax=Archangium minus TaxID=83450 RepID=A0ABY9WS83_9BACT|nr:hypothetical protein F0U60_06975 [Archangium minus]
MSKLTRTFALISLVILTLAATDSSAQTLCLSFVSFSAKKSTDCSITLAWTYNQCDTGRFYIDYSLNGSFYEPIAVINSAGDIGSQLSYTYVDNYAYPNDPSAPRVYYRVRFEGDTSGSRYSPVGTVLMGTTASCERNNTNRRAVIRDGIVIPNGHTSLKGDYANIIPGDFNGDGKTDFIRQEKGAWDDNDVDTAQVYFSNGDGFFTVVTPNDDSKLKGDYTNIIPGDFNGDGKTDFIRQEKGAWDDDDVGTAQVYFSNGDGFFTVVTPNNASLLKGDYNNIIPGDFNGDGRTDFIRQEKSTWDDNDVDTAQVFLSNGNGFFTVVTPNDDSKLKGDYTNIIPGDFNGDGKTDFIRQEKGAWDDDDVGTARSTSPTATASSLSSLRTTPRSSKGITTTSSPVTSMVTAGPTSSARRRARGMITMSTPPRYSSLTATASSLSSPRAMTRSSRGTTPTSSPVTSTATGTPTSSARKRGPGMMTMSAPLGSTCPRATAPSAS